MELRHSACGAVTSPHGLSGSPFETNITFSQLAPCCESYETRLAIACAFARRCTGITQGQTRRETGTQSLRSLNLLT